jgi:hypothetical protein
MPKGRFELPRPFEHYALNVARLPFRHFGTAGDAKGLYLLRNYKSREYHEAWEGLSSENKHRINDIDYPTV